MDEISASDLASARVLLLAYLSNQEDQNLSSFATTKLAQLRNSGKIDNCEIICECGNTLDTIEHDDNVLGEIREQLEENDHLTWPSFEAKMDQIVGEISDWKSVGLLLAACSQIEVPVSELDDLLDLAAWYTSLRVTPFVKSEGGWSSYRKQFPAIAEKDTNKAEMDIQSSKTIEYGSMVILKDKNSDSPITLPKFSDGNHFQFGSDQEEPSSEEFHSSSSPVLVTPPNASTPGTGTPVFIPSEPGSIDYNQEHETTSLDSSLINELIENLKSDEIEGVCDGEGGVNEEENDEIEDEEEIQLERISTVETLKPVSSVIPIHQSSTQKTITPSQSYDERIETYSNDEMRESAGLVIGSNDEGISHDPYISDEDVDENALEGVPENLKIEEKYDEASGGLIQETGGYMLLAGAAVIGIAAVYLKTSR